MKDMAQERSNLQAAPRNQPLHYDPSGGLTAAGKRLLFGSASDRSVSITASRVK